ncbi:hypothetical protein [Mesohalobacter halotolerans]|uniref:O-antigen ligase domain-containing protein n=1 Tax=Mesohalobacter halotolerans TaxID=1883405 RepID=A0A4U5TS89_9FLAO|nr:hypothetical protein [Mesohalobacter halotolerans]TKS56986.1 hypothetical protein FCN74_00760 [Mesohalobacter halotolerans]
MKIFNYLFLLAIFLGFFLPNNSNFILSIGGFNLRIRELAFFLLPIFNFLSVNQNSYPTNSKKIKSSIYILLIIVTLTESLKMLYFGYGLYGFLVSIKFGFPLFSSLIIILQKIKTNLKLVWQILLITLSISFILSFISIFINIPIYQNMEGMDYLDAVQGRIINSNSSFGLIGIYLLMSKNKGWYNKGLLVKLTSFLSIISLLISFNRTYLILALFLVFFLIFKNFGAKYFIKAILILIISFFIFQFAYYNFDAIKNQVDRRIVSILIGEKTVFSSAFEGNRDYIIEATLNNIIKGHWVFGLPYDAIMVKYSHLDSTASLHIASLTDTSFINILLRYGILPLLIIFQIFYKMLRVNKSKLYQYIFFLFFIASINIDSLMRHNSVLFLTMLFFISIASNNLNAINFRK